MEADDASTGRPVILVAAASISACGSDTSRVGIFLSPDGSLVADWYREYGGGALGYVNDCVQLRPRVKRFEYSGDCVFSADARGGLGSFGRATPTLRSLILQRPSGRPSPLGTTSRLRIERTLVSQTKMILLALSTLEARHHPQFELNLPQGQIRPHQKMSLRFWRGAFVVASAIAISCFALAATELPAIGANALLHPARRPLTIPTPEGCVTRKVAAVGAMLTGWICDGRAPRRGTLVYLHGVADNRESAVAIIRRFVPRGLTVVAFDSRAHGDSTGAACTYGYYEQDDLHRILDTVVGPIVLVGNLLGGAVALQEAAHDSRVQAIVAMAPFSDLRTIAAERAVRVHEPYHRARLRSRGSRCSLPCGGR